MKNTTLKIALFCIGLSFVVGCKKAVDVTPTDQTGVNNWILANMQYWYFWTDKIPTTTDNTLTPDNYFSSLLYKFDATLRPDGDRFSWIQQSADQLTASLSGESKTVGADFQLYRKSGSDELAGRVLYVFPNTPADKAGLKRGDIFAKATIDGQLLTGTNYSSLLGSGTDWVFTLGTYENAAFVNGTTTKNITAIVYQEDPLLKDSVYVRNNTKVGYMVYNQFVPTPNGTSNGQYDSKMDGIIGKFKAAGVKELIIDLRYNPGGYISSAVNLSSLIGKGISKSNVMYTSKYNPQATADITKNQGAGYFNSYFKDKAENIGGQIQRVIILTSSRSASASELVINSLKPYMEVYLIGDVTVGKNVGSITIKDDTKKIKWGMQPIVLKTFNSAAQSEYTAGFKPNVSVKESLSQPLFAFGDLRDPLLNEAFFYIFGSRPARRGIIEEVEADKQKVFSSIEAKAGGSNMFVEMK